MNDGRRKLPRLFHFNIKFVQYCIQPSFTCDQQHREAKGTSENCSNSIRVSGNCDSEVYETEDREAAELEFVIDKDPTFVCQ